MTLHQAQIWHSTVRGLQRLALRWERIFLPIDPVLCHGPGVFLRVKGPVCKVWCNGVLLTRTSEGFAIPADIRKPWENEFLIHGFPSTAWIASRATSAPTLPPMPSPRSDAPLHAAGEALCAFVVDQGPDAGDCFSFFDPTAMTFRMPTWRWDTGICLEALARLAHCFPRKSYQQAVSRMARRLMAVQLPHAPCMGGFPETSDLHMAGKKEPVLPHWVVPFNGAFIGAGLLAAAEVVEESLGKACREAAQRGYALMTAQAISSRGFLKGYYHLKNRQWQYHGQINDSGIFPRLGALLQTAGTTVAKEPLLLYTRALSSFIQGPGYVGRARWIPGKDTWPPGPPLFPEWRQKPKQIPAKIFARGQAWFLLGAAATWRLTTDPGVGDKVRTVAEYLLDHQDTSGFWHHDLGQPGQGLDVKGTAVVAWALLESRPSYSAAGGDPERLDLAVSRALNGLEQNQKTFFQGPLPGALCDTGQEGAIIYFRNRPMYTAYGTAAFILSCLERQKKHEDRPCL